MLLAGLILSMPMTIWAESSSTNYILWGDVRDGGGGFGTSASYRLHSSVSDLSNEQLSSGNYILHSGFQELYEEPRITMSISDSAVTLSPAVITSSSVSTASVTISISTNADFGYNLTVKEVAAFQNAYSTSLNPVTDGVVTAGSEEFGVAVSGDDAAFGDDQAISDTPLVIASRTIWTTGVTTTATFKAAITSGTQAGAYNGTVGFIATGNY